MQQPEQFIIPVSLGAEQAPHFAFGEPIKTPPDHWMARVRAKLADAWCLVTDNGILGPYASEEEAQAVIDNGIAGDLFKMQYEQ